MSSDLIRYHETGYCEIPAELERVAQASALLKAYCQKRCLDDTLWPQLELAFCEGLNNAIEHGCEEDPSRIVRIRWRWDDEEITIEIEDPGDFVEAPAIEGLADLPEDALAESGRGSFIISSLVDSCRHEACSYGHRLIMKKVLHYQRDVLDRMQEMYEALQQITNELNLSYAKLEALQGFSRDLADYPVLKQIIQKGFERLRAVTNIPAADVWMAEKKGLVRVYSEDESGDAKFDVLEYDSENSISKAYVEQLALTIDDCSALEMSDPLFAISSTAIVCPIVYQGESMGAIAMRSELGNPEILGGHLSGLAQVFAQFLGIAYTNAMMFKHHEDEERSRTQLEIASEIQRSLMPSSFPSNQHCRTTGKCVTAMAVGGDYIDAMEIRDVGLLIIIADVMGKGVPAALLATIFRTAIRSRLNLAETPGWLLAKINKQIHEELGHLNMFITAQAAFYSYEKKKLKLASAGHCPALLLRSNCGTVDQLSAEGIPLGIDPNDIYEERLIDLDTGDRVLFITDGIYEAENTAGAMLGIDGFSNKLSDIWQDGLESVPEKTLSYVDEFSEGCSAQDDRTVMALEIL